MKYLQHFDLIIENMAQAQKVLKDNNISKDDEKFKKIIDKTNKDGYTGFITKLVFELGLNLNGALDLYDDLKKYKVDIAQANIKNVLNDKNISNSKKIQIVIDEMRKVKKEKETEDFKLIFKDSGYNVYLINNYKGIMCTSSPAWCLKTKSQFDNYTKTKKGTQFVIIDSRLINDDVIDLDVPNSWSGNDYSQPGYDTTRYGITVYPSGVIDVFDDNNTQTQVSFDENGDLQTKSRLPIFVRKVLKKIRDYYEKNIQKFQIKTNSGTFAHAYEEERPVYTEEYENFKTILEDSREEIEDASHSFSNLVEYSTLNVDEIYHNFITKLIEFSEFETKEQLFDFLIEHKDELLSDMDITMYCGIYDVFLNDFIVYDQAQNRTDDVNDPDYESIALEGYNNPSISKREIPLSGIWIDEEVADEFIIKYYYGFQYDKYGQAALKQGFGSVHNFYEAIVDKFMEILITPDYIDFYELPKYDIADVEREELLNITDYKDGYKINFHFDELYKVREEPDDDDNMKDDMLKLVEDFSQYLKPISVEGNDIIIYICTDPPESNIKESLTERYIERRNKWEDEIRKRFS